MSDLADYFDRVRERTLRVAACIPPEQIEWTYKPGKYTLGDILRHLGSTERWMFAENAQQRPSRYPGYGRDLADGYDATLAFLRRMHEESMQIFRSLTDADLEKKCVTPGGAELRVGKGCARWPNTRFTTAARFTSTWESLESKGRRFTA